MWRCRRHNGGDMQRWGGALEVPHSCSQRRTLENSDGIAPTAERHFNGNGEMQRHDGGFHRVLTCVLGWVGGTTCPRFSTPCGGNDASRVRSPVSKKPQCSGASRPDGAADASDAQRAKNAGPRMGSPGATQRRAMNPAQESGCRAGQPRMHFLRGGNNRSASATPKLTGTFEESRPPPPGWSATSVLRPM
eukprot:gene16039-biopygen17226